MSLGQEKTDFGFDTIDIDKKASKIESLFSDVSNKYDLMNDIMSFGLHRKWKDYFVSLISPSIDKKYLDLAGGTGDIAFRISNKCKSGKNVTILDLTYDMLQKGISRDEKYNSEINRICASAEQIPFADSVYDAVTISYGIRNVTNIDKVLSESFRVLKTGGKFMCLEFCMPPEGALKKLYDLYSFNILPKMGKYISKDEDSYRYLAESIRKFPSLDHFKYKIEQVGFSNVNYEVLSSGITAIHYGYKLA